MRHTPVIPFPSDVPRFDVVDAITPVGTAPCADCGSRIVDTYFEADEGVICATCHARIAIAPAVARERQFGRALVFGIGAAAVSAAGYFALLATTGREMSVLLLLLGFAVGKAVRVGARGRGGRKYQSLAVTLTYLAIAATYVPFVMNGYSSASMGATDAVLAPSIDARYIGVAPTPSTSASAVSLGSTAAGFSGLVLLAIAAPILEGATNLLGLVFTVGALAQAWRMNRSTARVITGPYRVRP